MPGNPTGSRLARRSRGALGEHHVPRSAAARVSATVLKGSRARSRRVLCANGQLVAPYFFILSMSAVRLIPSRRAASDWLPEVAVSICVTIDRSTASSWS